MGPSKQLNQIIQIEHSIVKNPNWPATNQLAIYKRDRGATEKQLQVVVRAELEPGTARRRVRRADHSATLPPPAIVSSTDLSDPNDHIETGSRRDRSELLM